MIYVYQITGRSSIRSYIQLSSHTDSAKLQDTLTILDF